MEFLVKFKVLPDNAWDFIFPHGPKFSKYTFEFILASVVRDIAAEIPDKKIAAGLLGAGKSMVSYAASGLHQAWEDGDDICPPWWPFPWPFPGPWPGYKYEPVPVPWRFAEVNIKAYTRALRLIAGYTSVPEAGREIEQIAGSMSGL